MARTRAPGRLQDILDAALDVFSTVGYRRARMQDVAQAAGVSPGLLYTYAAGKEALFSLVIQREAGVDVDGLELPVPNPGAQDLEGVVERVLRASMRAPSLQAAEQRSAATDARPSSRAIVAEVYDSISDARRLLRLIERTALDWPELADHFYNRRRRPFVQRLGRYIARRTRVRRLPISTTSRSRSPIRPRERAWFANHRHGDHDGAAIDDAVARATVIELRDRTAVAQ